MLVVLAAAPHGRGGSVSKRRCSWQSRNLCAVVLVLPFSALMCSVALVTCRRNGRRAHHFVHALLLKSAYG